MAETRFYHLTRQTLEEALPRLLSKVLEKGHRVRLCTPNELMLDRLDTALWTWSEVSFLPHGRLGGPHSDVQPVLLNVSLSGTSDTGGVHTDGATPNINGADILCLVNEAANQTSFFSVKGEIETREEGESEQTEFAMVIRMFDGKDPEVVDFCRAEWKQLKAAGATLTYWQQTEQGAWEKKA